MQQQISELNVRKFESSFKWEMKNLQSFKWSCENFLMSKKIQFDEIDVSWRVKAFPRKYSGGYVHKNWSFQLIVDDKVSDGNGVYSFIIFQNLELGRQCKLITRVSDTQTKWFSSSESVKDFVISPDDYNYLHIEGNDAIFNFKLEYQICYYDQKPEAPIKVQPMISDVMDNIDHSGFSDEKKIDHLIMTMEKLFVQANRIYLNVKQIRDSTPFHSDPYGFD